MSKIPYRFTAIPNEFLTDEFLDDPAMMRLIRWIFARINHSENEIPLKNGKTLKLEPYEFVFGREICARETGISLKKVQNRMDKLKGQQNGQHFIEKTVSKTVSTFTVYRLVTENFSQINGQQNGQHFAEKGVSERGTIKKEKMTYTRKDHHPYPSSFSAPWTGTDDFFSVEEDQECNITSTIRPQVTDIVDLLAEDRKKHELLSPYNLPDTLLKELTQYPVDHLKDAVLAFDDYRASKAKKGVSLNNPRVELRNAIVEGWKREETPPSNQDAKEKARDAINGRIKESGMGYYQTTPEPPISIEVYPGVCLTQEELDACIAIKGSQEAVTSAIDYIMRSPGRKRKISNWPNAMATWEIKPDIKPRLKEHEEMAQRLSKTYEDYYQGLGYRCCIYNDRKKDQRGILFEPQSSYQDVFFVPFIDGEFKEKVSKFLRDKKMQLGRISPS